MEHMNDVLNSAYIDRMWEEYHKIKEELADAKSKLAQAEDEIDLWKNKWADATVEAAKFRGYNTTLAPLVMAAKELEHSVGDAYAVNKVRQAYRNIEETWEDVRARCS
jgi:hypothetical protein